MANDTLNREIIFRGQQMRNDCWVYGFLTKDFGRFSIDGFEVSAESVGQYTGVLDKSGNQVFEGDILSLNAGINESYITSVTWGKKAHGFTLKCDTSKFNRWGKIKYYALPSPSEIEIIGNTTQNPELLK